MKTLSLNRITVTAFAVLFSVFLISCQKENSLSNTADTLTEEEAANFSDESSQAEASFDDAEDVSMIAAEEEGDASMYGRSTDTIDFGPNGCLCADGKYRRGAIVIHLTAPIRRPGAVMTITFVDFYLNRAHIEGTKVLSNLSENGNIKFTVQVTGGKVTFPNGRGYKYDGIKYVKQIQGGNTRPIRDDAYSIEGRSKTEFNGGLVVNLNTESPLIKKVVCPWISNGVLKIKINSRVLFLDYGAPNNGNCDNKAMLTWNNGNNQRLITLP